MNNDPSDATDDFVARFEEANKEHSLVRSIGDLYVDLLRCSRSSDLIYRKRAAQSLVDLVKTLALEPETPIEEAMDAASKRVGWKEEPEDKFEQSLNRIARAAITYLIEASGHTKQNFLSRRRGELVREIDEFHRLRLTAFR
jgi:hypothetical protein